VASLARILSLAGVYTQIVAMSSELPSTSARSAFLVISDDPLKVRELINKV